MRTVPYATHAHRGKEYSTGLASGYLHVVVQMLGLVPKSPPRTMSRPDSTFTFLGPRLDVLAPKKPTSTSISVAPTILCHKAVLHVCPPDIWYTLLFAGVWTESVVPWESPIVGEIYVCGGLTVFRMRRNEDGECENEGKKERKEEV